jgi:hypothetical protein
MVAFVTEAARKEIEALDPDCPCAKEMSKLDDVDNTVAEEVKKFCDAATLREIGKMLLLVGRLEKTPAHEREIIKSELNSIVEKLITRVEVKSGPLKLPKDCRHLFFNF